MKAFSEFCRCITKLFQLVVKFEYIPKLFKVGIIIPIPKGDEDRTRQGKLLWHFTYDRFCKAI